MVKKTWVGVDAAGVRAGGGISVLDEIIQGLISQPGLVPIILGLESEVEKAKASWPVRTVSRNRNRLAHHTWASARAASELGCVALVGVAGLTLSYGDLPIVNIVQQALPFHPQGLVGRSRQQRIRIHLLRDLMRISAARADLTIVQSESMRLRLARSVPDVAPRIAVCGPSVPAASTVCSPRQALPVARRVLWLGSGAPHKRPELALETLQVLRSESNADWRMDMPGVKLAHLPGYVSRPGPMSRDRFLAYMDEFTVALNTSVVETVGLMALEAMGRALPVVSVEADYASEIYGDGAVLRRDNPSELARAILSVTADNSAYFTASRKALARGNEAANTNFGAAVAQRVAGMLA